MANASLSAATKPFRGADVSSQSGLGAAAQNYRGVALQIALQTGESQRWIALIIVGSLAVIVLAGCLAIFQCEAQIENTIKLIQALMGPVIGVVGAVTGFYYGTRASSAADQSSD